MRMESLAGMFSQRSRAGQGVGSSVMSVIVGFFVQKLMGGGGGGGVIGSMLSGLKGGGSSGSGTGCSDTSVRHVQQNTGIKDLEQAR